MKVMPIVNVQMLAGRPPNKINEVMKNITTIVATTTALTAHIAATHTVYYFPLVMLAMPFR